MDFKTACQVLAEQTLPALDTPDTFLGRLRQGQPPIPGQVTSLLLALKVIQDGLQGADSLDRELAQSLFLVAYESRNLFESGRALRADWPPLLDEDLARLAIAAYRIFANEPLPDAAGDAL
ncbi:MAG: Dethiobiotin synthetase [Cyanobacteria bacterium J06598_3]